MQSELESVWDKMRWIRDVVQLGKERFPSQTIVLRRMFTAGAGTTSSHTLPSFARRGSRITQRKCEQDYEAVMLLRSCPLTQLFFVIRTLSV